MLILKNTVKNLHSRFTQIPNELINDEQLSPAAKGVYCYLASKPEGWRFTIDEISSHFSKPIRAAIHELEASRWLLRQTEPIKGKGKGFDWAWYIAATPFTDKEVATIRDFNYSSKITMIVESADSYIYSYSNTDYSSNTDSCSNTDSNLSLPISPSLSLENKSPSSSPKGENQTADEVTIALSNFKHAWNDVLVPRFEDENGKTVIPKIATFSGTRRAHAKQRLTELAAYMKEHGIKKGLLEYFIKDFVADRFEHSQFLQGRVQPRTTGGRPFEFSADRVLQQNIFNHMLEYMYDDRPEYRN